MRTTPPLAAAGLYLASSLAIDFVSHLNAVPPLHITHWNPSSALGLVLLFKFGPGATPWLLLASLLAEISFRGAVAPLPYLIVASALTAASYGAVTAFLTRVSGFDPALRRIADLAWFIIATLLGTLLASCAYVGSFTLAGVISADELGANVLGLWFDEFIGILVLTPLILVHWDFRQHCSGFCLSPEIFLQAASLALGLWLFHSFDTSDDLLFLPLIWIALRHGIRGTTIVVLITQIGLLLALKWSVHRDWSVAEFHLLMATFAITGLALGVVISERERVTAQLHERDAELGLAMRVVGVGELASSLAHELNQPLSASQNYVRASRLILERDPPDLLLLGDTLAKLQAEIARAGDAVRHLRSFFQTGSPKVDTKALRQLIDECLRNSASRLTRHRIEVGIDLPEQIPLLQIDPIQILIVLHNLIGNAIDAITEANPPQRQIRISAGVAEPGWVRVCIADSGAGVTAAVAAKMFVAVATTKADGMGLGLMISRSLVEAHGGKLWLDSGSAANARFCFTLPSDVATEPPPEAR